MAPYREEKNRRYEIMKGNKNRREEESAKKTKE